MRLLFYVLLLSLTIQVQAEPVTMVREYTYNASENDSKVTARKAALEQLQRLAIEEVGIQVQSSFRNSEKLDKDDFTRKVQSDFKTFSQALTKSRILEEKWNGESFYIKAEIEVDPDGVSAAIKNLATGNEADLCSANENAVQNLINKPANLERNQALFELTENASFDSDCNDWMYRIFSALSHSMEYPVTEYRPYLYTQLKNIKSYNLPDLLPSVITYSIAEKGSFSKAEWQQIMSSLKSIPAKNIRYSLVTLAKVSERYPAGKDTGSADQPYKEFRKEAEEIIKGGSKGNIGDPAIEQAILIQDMIVITSRYQPAYSAELFEEYNSKLPDINKVIPAMVSFYNHYGMGQAGKNFQKQAESALNEIFVSVDFAALDYPARRDLYEIFHPLIDDFAKTENDKERIRKLIKRYPQQVSDLFSKSIVNETKRNTVFITYRLPGVSDICSPEQCARELFRDGISRTDTSRYLDYLIAYGADARAAEGLLIDKLERVLATNRNPARTEIKKGITQIFRSIQTRNPKALGLLIKELNDLDYKIPDYAGEALSELGKPAFNAIKLHFDASQPLTQRRMVKALGNMPANKDIEDFLHSIKAADQAMKFAIEDALRAQSL